MEEDAGQVALFLCHAGAMMNLEKIRCNYDLIGGFNPYAGQLGFQNVLNRVEHTSHIHMNIYIYVYTYTHFLL